MMLLFFVFCIEINFYKSIKSVSDYASCPAYWHDRLLKLRAGGFNAVEVYVEWSFHEETAGKWDFAGPKDVVGFIKTAQKIGLWVILRLAKCY